MSSNITKRLEMNKRTSQFGSGFRWYRYRVNFANLYWNLCIASNLVPIVPSISQKLATPFPGLHGRFIYQAWLLLLCRVRVNCIAGVGAVEVSRRSVDRVCSSAGLGSDTADCCTRVAAHWNHVEHSRRHCRHANNHCYGQSTNNSANPHKVIQRKSQI